MRKRDGVVLDMRKLRGMDICDMRQLAKALHRKSVNSIYRLRARGHEPPRFYVGNKVVYKVEDVRRFYLEELPAREGAKIAPVFVNRSAGTRPNFLAS